MKLKNLLLGSVTAAGLMTGAAYAADLGVLTSVDVCDQLGISGLTISSDTNCLKISGEVDYDFSYGSWDETDGSFSFPSGSVTLFGYEDSEAPTMSSNVSAKLNFEATADSSFGPAKAVLKLVADHIDGNGDNLVEVDQAYVTIGESTVIMAGHKGSVFNAGDDEPLNWLGLFNSAAANTGVGTGIDYPGTSNAIQISTDLGNGFSLSGGLEQLENGENADAVGVISYKGDNISAHASVVAYDALSSTTGGWDLHAGISATLDTVKIVAAIATDSNSNWNVLGSAEATFDMFTIAGSVEAADVDSDTSTGFGASLSAEVSEGVKLNVGGRWSDYNEGDDQHYEVAVGAEAAVAEKLTLSGAVGYITHVDDEEATYAWAKLAWAPGGGFDASIKGTMQANDGETAYKIETEFKKTFE